MTIDASGNDPTPATDNGDGKRVFNIDNGNNITNANVQIAGLTLTGGDVTGSGGGIFSRENLTILNTTIRDNSATTGGGIQGIGGNVTVTSSTISGNFANNGGGIYGQSVSLTVTDSTISGNAANSSGGGICTPYGGDAWLTARSRVMWRTPTTITPARVGGSRSSITLITAP